MRTGSRYRLSVAGAGVEFPGGRWRPAGPADGGHRVGAGGAPHQASLPAHSSHGRGEAERRAPGCRRRQADDLPAAVAADGGPHRHSFSIRLLLHPTPHPPPQSGPQQFDRQMSLIGALLGSVAAGARGRSRSRSRDRRRRSSFSLRTIISKKRRCKISISRANASTPSPNSG